MARSESCTSRPNTLPQTNLSSYSFRLQSGGGPYIARRVCRRDPLPRRLNRIWGRGPKLAFGQESAPCRCAQRILEGERASEGRGCLERGTLNADRKANRKGAGTVQRPYSWRESQKPAQKLEETLTRLEEECKGESTRRENGHSSQFIMVSWTEPDFLSLLIL
jgi:hypothetical protein